jgi:hypothetical protein
MAPHTKTPSGETRQPNNRMTRGRKENKKTRSDNREYASGRHNTAEKLKGETTEEGYKWVLGGLKERGRQRKQR